MKTSERLGCWSILIAIIFLSCLIACVLLADELNFDEPVGQILLVVTISSGVIGLIMYSIFPEP